MRLLYIYDEMPKTYQKYMLFLLDSIKTKSNVKTLSYTKEDADYAIESYGFKDYCQRLLYKLKLSAFPSLDLKIMSKFDVLHLQHSYLFSKFLRLLEFPTSKRPKIIITLRGGDTYVKPWTDKRWRDFFENYGSKVDGFITMSEHQKQYLQKWGVEKEKIHVIPVSFGNKTVKKPKYISNETIKIVSAFRMCWEKNIEANLRVIALLKSKGQLVEYGIYGDGPDLGQVYYLIDKYGLNKEVNYLGKVDNCIFKDKLLNYDFYLQLSHSESFGASVIEAQSQGLPCVVSNSGGLPEAIISNQTGYCVDAFDVELAVAKILKLYNNSELYHSFSIAAIDYVNNNFTVKHEVEKLKFFYEELVRKS